MAIVKEDGSGLANANVYADVADLVAYASLRAETITTDIPTLEGALYVAAQDWVDGKHEFSGTQLNASQGMKMPTSTITLPATDIVNANCYTAILQLKGVLFPVQVASTGGKVKRVKKKLDVLESETEYFEDGSTEPDTEIAENMIKKYLSGGSSSGQPSLVVS